MEEGEEAGAHKENEAWACKMGQAGRLVTDSARDTHEIEQEAANWRWVEGWENREVDYKQGVPTKRDGEKAGQGRRKSSRCREMAREGRAP